MELAANAKDHAAAPINAKLTKEEKVGILREMMRIRAFENDPDADTAADFVITQLFFDNADSIVNRAKRIKKAVAAAYGFISPEYQTVNGFVIKRR